MIRFISSSLFVVHYSENAGGEQTCTRWKGRVAWAYDRGGLPRLTMDVTDSGDGTADGQLPADATIRLLERARKGDLDALNDLFARHIPALRRWASGRLPRWARDLADTHDLVQETVLQAFKRVEAFEPRGDGALQAYLRQAVMNRIRSELRRVRRRPPAEELDEFVPSEGTSPLEAARRHEQLDRYHAALSRLSGEERDLIVARLELGLTYEEAAVALGKPSWNAARMATARALLHLALELKRG
jgi:RNA polymerase sigma factor (sigma-70 family)